MRLHHEHSSSWCELSLPRRSLYVLHGPARYDWAHSVLADESGAPRGRRISFLFRDRPTDEQEALVAARARNNFVSPWD